MLHKSVGVLEAEHETKSRRFSYTRLEAKFFPEEDWHIFLLGIPRWSISGQLIWGRVLRRWDGRRWIYKKYLQHGQLSSFAE